MKMLTLITFYILSLSQLNSQVIQDEDALALVHQLEKKYNSFESIEVQFDLVIDIPEEESILQSGKMIQSGDAYVIQSQAQDIYSDGQSVWIHLKDDNEVQINSVEEGEGSLTNLTPTGILAMFDENTYEYAIVKKEAKINQIEFKPMDQDSEFSKIRINVDTASLSLLSTKVFYKDGIRSTLDIGDVTTNQSYDSTLFVFDKAAHPGIYIEDLRID